MEKEAGNIGKTAVIQQTTNECANPAIKLRQTLKGHASQVHEIALSPDGNILASSSADGRLCLWQMPNGIFMQKFEHGHFIRSLAWSPDGRIVASGTNRVDLRDIKTGRHFRTLKRAEYATKCKINETEYNKIQNISWSADGRILALNQPGIIDLWNTGNWKLIKRFHINSYAGNCIAWAPNRETLAFCTNSINFLNRSNVFLKIGDIRDSEIICVAWSPDGGYIATGSIDCTIRIWDLLTKSQTHVLEGHVDPVISISFMDNGRFLVSLSENGTMAIWRTDTWVEVAHVDQMCELDGWATVAIHENLSSIILPGKSKGSIDIWDIDLRRLNVAESKTSTVHYVNAKALLVGDTGVGKTGLGLVLTGNPYAATDSTHGRNVWTFEASEVELDGKLKQTRETLLWDLAGQPGYRVIHQLHLNEVAVALVIFDSRSETDPLAGVHHWDRALRLARQRQETQSVPMKKFLISARNDRGGVSVSKSRIEKLIEDLGFEGYLETSAKEGWQINELKDAVRKSIDWEKLPVVASSELFVLIKEFLLESKKSGRFLATSNDLYIDFIDEHPEAMAMNYDMHDQFETCIGRLENRDLIRRLSFGGYVLLQPEYLDSYASAIVNAAKNEPDGLGSIAEDDALAGRFHIPGEQKINDKGEEQLLLHSTTEELVQHDLALREITDDGRYLVFPSQFNRDYEDAPEPKGKAVTITFEGPVQSIYATLVVRLGHSGRFETDRGEMWRNAVKFIALAGGKCGIYLREFAEGRGQLILFFDPKVSNETQFHFEEYILAHLNRRALNGSINIVRFFICPKCATQVPDAYVKILREKGLDGFNCPCGCVVSLVAPKEKLMERFTSRVEDMDRSADYQRDFNVFMLSARGETQTKDFFQWAGGEKVTLAIVFTDVVGSTFLGQTFGDERMSIMRNAHFRQGRSFIKSYNGREIKSIGDSLMAAFHSVHDALDFALALHKNTGDKKIKIRAGIHIGALQVEESDIFGGTVNFAARVVGAINGPEIWLSERAKQDIDQLKSQKHSHLKWIKHDDVDMKGFNGKFILWSLVIV